MNYTSTERLFALLRNAIGGWELYPPVFQDMTPKDWTEVINLSMEQNVAAVAFEAVEALRKPVSESFPSTGSGQAPVSEVSGCFPDIDNLMEWLGQSSYVEEETKAQFSAAKELAEQWHKAVDSRSLRQAQDKLGSGQAGSPCGIRTFVMKGFSIGMLYPKMEHRNGCDMDCYLRYENDNENVNAGEEGDKIVEGLEVEVDRSYYKNSKFTYKALTVENHRHVLPVKGSRKAKELEKWLLERMIPSTPIYIRDTYLESPSPMFMAVHVLAHAQEHFLSEGITLRHVCDWAVILHRFQKVSKVPEVSEGMSFWNIWKKTCERFGLLKFGYALSRLAHKVCGVEIPFECPHDDNADNRLLQDILNIADKPEKKKSFARRIQLVKGMYRDRWKFLMFSDDTALSFIFKRIFGYLFDKDID